MSQWEWSEKPLWHLLSSHFNFPHWGTIHLLSLLLILLICRTPLTTHTHTVTDILILFSGCNRSKQRGGVRVPSVPSWWSSASTQRAWRFLQGCKPITAHLSYVGYSSVGVLWCCPWPQCERTQIHSIWLRGSASIYCILQPNFIKYQKRNCDQDVKKKW